MHNNDDTYHFTWKKHTESSRSMLNMNKGRRDKPLNKKAKLSKQSIAEQIAAIKAEIERLQNI